MFFSLEKGPLHSICLEASTVAKGKNVLTRNLQISTSVKRTQFGKMILWDADKKTILKWSPDSDNA